MGGHSGKGRAGQCVPGTAVCNDPGTTSSRHVGLALARVLCGRRREGDGGRGRRPASRGGRAGVLGPIRARAGGRAWGQLELAHILHGFIGRVRGRALSGWDRSWAREAPGSCACMGNPPSRPGRGGGGDGADAPSELPPLGLCFSGVCTAHFFFGVLSAVRDTGEGRAGQPGPTCVEG